MTAPTPFPTPNNDDLRALRQATNLLDLVPGLRRVASTQGGEYEGACPFCGGVDRFRVQPNANGGRWWCRQCSPSEHWGDVLDFVQQRDQVDLPTAKAILSGAQPARRALAPPVIPPTPFRAATVPTREPNTCFAYHAADAVLVFQVCRWDLTPDERPLYGDKTKLFRQRRPDGQGGWIYNVKGVPRVLYNLPAVLAADAAEPVFWVEGEKCADALIALGFLATTNPGGTAGGWQPSYTDALQGRRVILIPDADDKGQELGAKVRAALLPVAAALKVLTLPAEYNDVADWLAAGATSDDLVSYAKATPAVTGDEPDPPAANGPYRLLNRAQIAALPPPEWLITNLLERDTVAMLYGMTGIGKTFVTLDLALAVATGRTWWGQPVKQGPVLYVLGEGMSGLNGRLLAWEAIRGQRAANIHFVVDPVNLMGGTVATDFAHLLPEPPALIIFDTLARCIGAGDENDNTDMNQMVATVTALQKATQATVLLVHHPGKSDTGPRGASCIPNACDTILKLTGSAELLKLQGEKQRNGPTDNPWQFALEVVEVGTRADTGGPLTSCVVQLANGDRIQQADTLSPNQRTLMTILSGRTLNPASAQELIDASSLARSTVYRELETLAERELIQEDRQGRGRRWTTTPKGLNLLDQTAFRLDLDSPTKSQGIPETNAESVSKSVPVPHPYNVGLGRTNDRDFPCTDCGVLDWVQTPAGTWRCRTCGQAG